MKYLPFGKEQYSVGYKDDEKIKPSFIYFRKMGTYKVFDERVDLLRVDFFYSSSLG